MDQALMAAIVQSSDDAIVSSSINGRITGVNRAAEAMYGYEDEELIGKPLSLLLERVRLNEMEDILERLRNGHRVAHYETVGVKKDGSTLCVSLTVSPMSDADGVTIGVSSSARDITERKRAEETARTTSLYARSLIEASLDPLVTISAEGKITDVNEGSIKVTGVPREALIGTDFSNYFTEPEKAREGYQQVFAKGLVTDYPLTIRHRDGRLTDVLYNASVYKDARGKVLGVFAAARDVTAQKRAEAEIAEQAAAESAEQRNKDLERLVELERFQRLTVGRELRMIELKKELAVFRKIAGSE